MRVGCLLSHGTVQEMSDFCLAELKQRLRFKIAELGTIRVVCCLDKSSCSWDAVIRGFCFESQLSVLRVSY